MTMKRKTRKQFFAFAVATSIFVNAIGIPVSAQTNQSIEFLSSESYVDEDTRAEINECASNIAGIYCSQYPESVEIINDIISEVVNDRVFIEIFEEEGKSSFYIVEDALRDILIPCDDIIPYAAQYSLNVPVVNQACYDSNGKLLNYYCGPAAVLQALIGNGKLSNTSSNKSETKIKSVGSSMGTTSINGTYISSITSYMQNYYGSASPTYQTKYFSKYTYNQAYGFVAVSLRNGAAPILRVGDTSLLSYYKGVKLSHYVTISGCDLISQTITIVDPHYNSAYRGRHTISMAEFNEIMKNDGWMSVYTSSSSNPYEH